MQRLQDNVYLADRDISQLRSRDATRATQLGTELDDLRDEVVYLKVKLRKERTLSRTEYADVGIESRICDRARAAMWRRGTRIDPLQHPPSSSTASSATTASRLDVGSGEHHVRAINDDDCSSVEVPVGTEIDVRLQNTLNSGTAQVEDRFEGTTLADVIVDGRLAIPAGSIFRGVVTRGRARDAYESHVQDDGELRSGHASTAGHIRFVAR